MMTVVYDAGLAVRANANLVRVRVRVIQGDGATMAFDPADIS